MFSFAEILKFHAYLKLLQSLKPCEESLHRNSSYWQHKNNSVIGVHVGWLTALKWSSSCISRVKRNKLQQLHASVFPTYMFCKCLVALSAYTVGLSRQIHLYINVFSGYVIELSHAICPPATQQEEGNPLAAAFLAPSEVILSSSAFPHRRKDAFSYDTLSQSFCEQLH